MMTRKIGAELHSLLLGLGQLKELDQQTVSIDQDQDRFHKTLQRMIALLSLLPGITDDDSRK